MKVLLTVLFGEVLDAAGGLCTSTDEPFIYSLCFLCYTLSPLSRSRSANENVADVGNSRPEPACSPRHFQLDPNPLIHLRTITCTPHLPPPAMIELEDEAATDAALMCLWAEILVSPPTGTGALPGTCPSAEHVNIMQVLSETTPIEVFGLGLVTSGIDTVDWVEQDLTNSTLLISHPY
ncbi:hypothetical protein EDB19DRAFT_1838549 [Suillus lakei]|nr:hypothetical protein EDB19DRAFT_1838549 [Suillus lakei]